MSAYPLEVQGTGLVTAVGLSAAATCAAVRAKLTNPVETHFRALGGEWIVAHQVPLDAPWRGLAKLSRMAAMAIEEALHDVPRVEWAGIPLLLCVAEKERPGRLEGLDDRLIHGVQSVLGAHFAVDSAVVPHGRVSVAIALSFARRMISHQNVKRVLIAATDSLLYGATLQYYDRQERLLSPKNSNGFAPGEGAGAVLVGPPREQAGSLICSGLGFGVEPAHVESGEPLRGDGLTAAIKAALQDGKCQMHEMDYRIADISGEQYYFKEAALAVLRTLRQRKEEFDVWHPAECTGEAGALAGAAILAVADAACRKAYTKGCHILAHMAGDSGRRAALTMQFTGT